MIGLSCGEKNYDNMLSCFHPIPERYWQADRIAISMSRVSVLTRDKNLFRTSLMSVTSRTVLFTTLGDDGWLHTSTVTAAALNSSCRHPDLASRSWRQQRFTLSFTVFDERLELVPVKRPTNKVRPCILVVWSMAVCAMLTDLATTQTCYCTNKLH